MSIDKRHKEKCDFHRERKDFFLVFGVRKRVWGNEKSFFFLR